MISRFLNLQQVQALEEIHENSAKPFWLKGKGYNWLKTHGFILVEAKDGVHVVTSKGYKKLYEYWRDRYNRLESEVIKP